jgi:hypothetical protein
MGVDIIYSTCDENPEDGTVWEFDNVIVIAPQDGVDNVCISTKSGRTVIGGEKITPVVKWNNNNS